MCMKGLLILQSAQNHPPLPDRGNSYKLVPVDALEACANSTGINTHLLATGSRAYTLY